MKLNNQKIGMVMFALLSCIIMSTSAVSDLPTSYLHNGANSTFDHFEDEVETLLTSYKDIVLAFTLGFGFLQVFYGFKAFRCCMFLMGAIGGGIGLFYCSDLILENHHLSDPNSEVYVMVGCTAFGAILSGLILYHVYEIGIFGLGCGLGCVISIIGVPLLHKVSFIASLPVSNDFNLVYMVMAGLGLLFGLIAIYSKKSMIILSTSVIGAFYSAYSVGHYAGDFPFPNEVWNKITESGFASLNQHWLMYWGAIAGLIFLGILFQCCTVSDDDDVDTRSDDESYRYENLEENRIRRDDDNSRAGYWAKLKDNKRNRNSTTKATTTATASTSSASHLGLMNQPPSIMDKYAVKQEEEVTISKYEVA